MLIGGRFNVCALFIDAAPGRPTDWLFSHCGWWLTSHPLTHWELITIQWTHSGYWLQLMCRPQSRWICVSTVVKRSLIFDPGVHCSRKFSTGEKKILDTEKFFRVSSLASLVNIPSCCGWFLDPKTDFQVLRTLFLLLSVLRLFHFTTGIS